MLWIESIKLFVLGMVQGFSEFLPISSSGHLKLFQHFFQMESDGNSFVSIMLHVGTLGAVLIVYHRLIWDLIVEFFKTIGDVFTGRFRFKTMNSTRRMMVMLICATLVLGIMVIPFGEHSLKDYMEMLNELPNLVPLGIAFMVTGVLLITTFVITAKRKKNRNDATIRDALIIGGSQCVATMAGISRSGATMATGLLCGLSREYMIRFSFILSIPAIAAAALSETKTVIEDPSTLSVDLLPVVVGMISALVFGILSIKMIEWLLRKDRYQLFGYYCLTLGLIVVILGLIGV